jgi:putative peptide zinc metalloprotease protein
MEPLLSPDWYRVASMRPRLRAGVRVSAQRVRGESWYLLTDPVSGRHHRFNHIAYRLIAACDGERTLDDVWAARAALDGEQAATQGDAIRVFAQAFGANLFIGDVAPDAAAVVKAQLRGQRQRLRAGINPLAFKVPLWDPDAFLGAHIGRVAWLFTPVCAWLLLALACLGALLLSMNAAEYMAFARERLGTGRMLLTLWLAYPLIKGLHELAHAFAVKAFGGEVHEIGITLLMLTPVPYVDASASMGFADKHRRIAVAGAGIAVELVLATLALCLWLVLEPGLPKDVAFAVVLVGGLSTLSVNGNPLLRFDGYHMLCDAAELPNLARRSTQLWQYATKRWLLRAPGARFDGHAPGALPWLLAYAPLSWAYRAVLMVLLTLWAAQTNHLLGLAALALALWLLLAQPVFAALRYLAASPELHGRRTRAALVALLGSGVLGVLAFGAELPHRTHAPGVVWLQDEALVRLGSDGFVEEFLAADGDSVAAGQPLLRLSNDALHADLQRVRAELARREVERAASFDANALRTGVAGDELARLAAERDRLQQRADQLLVRAAVAGRLVIAPRLNRVGQYLPQGQLVAHVLAPGAPLVRALVRNEDIAQVRDGTRAIGVALAHAPAQDIAATLAGAVPRAGVSLPSAALGEAAGGSIALDAADKTGRTALEPHFQLDLRLAPGVDARIGARALVTFRHADITAAELLTDFARRSFLRYFER